VAVNAVVCLDKDGTLVEDVPYNVDPALIRLRGEAPEALRRLHRAGFRLAVVTNQPGVAKGSFDEAALAAVEQRLRGLCAAAGVPLAGFYYCPHHPDGRGDYAIECECRKPRPGLVERALREQRADTSRSWLIGDILDDVEAGTRAGCRSLLLDVGNETEWVDGPHRRPYATVRSLVDAAELITRETAA
jgi:D-glycero-D-manno-heptose 1,7-bisphosphate phosphatase